jgi:D12 class N6 adenine-specific DNA methyltransferase
MKSPFPWFGGKSKVARLVWDRFGNVPNYVEPFAGSLAVLLRRPHEPKNETVNDKDALLSNFWRALQTAPEELCYHADWPVSEADLHARHQWLVYQLTRTPFRERMLTDPDFYDAKIAGWWVWGVSQWIGSGWCSQPGWTGRSNAARAPRGIPMLGKGGQGVHRLHRKLPAIGGMARGVQARQIPNLNRAGMGVHRVWPHLSGDAGDSGQGIFAAGSAGNLYGYMQQLAGRLRRVRVCCGDWARVLGPSPTTKIGVTGVFLDPPYSVEERDDVYNEESRDLSHAVRDWALGHSSDPDMRIALCGYEGEHDMPPDWECVPWKANGGYANQKNQGTRGKENAHRERVWFSPSCLHPGLFAEEHRQIEMAAE